jgi:hypothetical protein
MRSRQARQRSKSLPAWVVHGLVFCTSLTLMALGVFGLDQMVGRLAHLEPHIDKGCHCDETR